jgi:hypothetical protein
MRSQSGIVNGAGEHHHLEGLPAIRAAVKTHGIRSFGRSRTNLSDDDVIRKPELPMLTTS